MAGAKQALNMTPVAGEANADSSGFNKLVTLPKVLNQSGYNRPVSEVDAGLVTGDPYLLAGEVSEEFRARVELDSILDSYVFNNTTQEFGKHSYLNTTMTATWLANGLNTNASGITTANTGISVRTYQPFPIFGAAESLAYLAVAFTGTWAVNNKTQNIGIFNSATTLPYAPTDGCGIRVTNLGLMGFANFNGVEQLTLPWKVSAGGADFEPVIGEAYDIVISAGRGVVTFWMDLKNGQGLTRMASLKSGASGMVMATSSAPFAVQEVIGGTASSAVSGMRVVAYTISQGGFANTRSEAVTAACITGGQQGQQGHTSSATTALYTNNLTAGAGVAMTNTTPALGVGLGGQFSALPTLAVGTDGIVCSYQNPAATASLNGRTLVITGVKVDVVVTTALTGGQLIYVVALNYGHTNVNIAATTEAAASKQRRPILLGTLVIPANAAVGAFATTGYFTLNRPIPVFPGEHAAITAKNLGVVTSAGVATFIVSYDYGWVL